MVFLSSQTVGSLQSPAMSQIVCCILAQGSFYEGMSISDHENMIPEL